MLASGLLLVALLSCLTIMVLMSVWRQRKFWGKLPPGPRALPFIGNYLQLNTEQMYNSLMKISECYGPVFTIHLGTRRIVVLCGHEAVKEALVDQAEEFSGRGEQATFDWLFKGYESHIFSASQSPCLHLLVKASSLFQALSVSLYMFFSFLQVSLRILLNFYSHFPDLHISHFPSFPPASFSSCDVHRQLSFPFLLPPQLYEMFSSVMKHLPGPQQQAFKELQGLEDFIAKKVEQNQRTLDPNSPRDFIDSFLIRMQEEQKHPNSEFHMKNLVMTTLNLFFAGTETVSTTLRYGFLLLMKHPDVEAKVHEEIDRVIGKNRQPKFEDRAKMPYTEAVIHEIQRFGDMIPMGVARRVTKDTKFRNFLLPKVLPLPSLEGPPTHTL
ncbi:Cytochrome P450 2A13 [Myotis brandtii]|uniref:Cytochrome P450 n=1 Tax=Myotis brandtii TaxID=109478 RepID=S7PLZ3_MYOBR|nr:Cytochrome P450 2A13 [Myotis brandtii]